jgi:hypothetical protein
MATPCHKDKTAAHIQVRNSPNKSGPKINTF